MTGLLNRIAARRFVPVLTVPETHHAVPLAEALIRGGLDVLEVTLRTPCALEAITEMKRAFPTAAIGAGTVLSAADVSAAESAGAEFLVSPGTPAGLQQALKGFDGVVFPGAATVSESMALLDEGFTVQKFFPAEPSGGATYLKSIASPLPQVTFMPTGGITLETAPDYLALPNVTAVGGSWVAPSSAIAAGDWRLIETLAAGTVAQLAR